jgi:hypothetical protein
MRVRVCPDGAITCALIPTSAGFAALVFLPYKLLEYTLRA